jgi:threonine dehydratase
VNPVQVDLPRILAAQRLLSHHLIPTPIWTYPALNAVAGATVYVKHENVQPVGAFKVRGGLTLLASLSPAQRARGVITYSTGNHAQSIAYAARAYDSHCVVVMPANANQVKVRALTALGATVELVGAELSVSREHAEQLAASQGLHLISPGDTPELILGVGTLYLETFSAVPDLEAVLVPVGSGTGVAAACLVAQALAPKCEIIGVQSSSSPAGHDSWHSGQLEQRPNRTTVEGLATGCGFALPQHLMLGKLADFLLVSDERIGQAAAFMATHAHTLAEGAGAAALAGVLANPERFAGRKIATICTGGNASPAEIASLSV